MCQIVVVNRGEVEIGTVRQFKEYFKVSDLIVDENYKDIDEDCCLCQIDVAANLKKIGIPYKWDCCDYYVGEGLDLIRPIGE